MNQFKLVLLACIFIGSVIPVIPEGVGQVDVVFANDSGRRCEIFWISGGQEETFVKSFGPGEKYVERTQAQQKFVAKFDRKIGDAFITTAEERQYRSITGNTNHAKSAAKEVSTAGTSVDVIFSNESGLRCEIYWVNEQGEQFVKSLGPGEKYVESAHSKQKFLARFGGSKMGDAFILSAEKHQFRSIKGNTNQMTKAHSDL
jgi:hypothetical protein